MFERKFFLFLSNRATNSASESSTTITEEEEPSPKPVSRTRSLIDEEEDDKKHKDEEEEFTVLPAITDSVMKRLEPQGKAAEPSTQSQEEAFQKG